jgi:hypothetical protein
MLGHKTNVSKFKEIEISNIFSDQNGTEVEINSLGELTNM